MISLPYGHRQTDTYMHLGQLVYYSDRVKIIPEYLNPSPSSSLSLSLNSVPPFINIRRDNTIRAATNLAYQVLHLRRRHAGQGEHETRLPHISASTPIIATLSNGISPTSLLSYQFPALCLETPVISQLYLIRSSRLPLLR